jgi:hypothetical protein
MQKESNEEVMRQRRGDLEISLVVVTAFGVSQVSHRIGIFRISFVKCFCKLVEALVLSFLSVVSWRYT